MCIRDSFFYDANQPSGLPHYNPGQIHEDADGTLWIAADGGGLIRFDRQTESFKRYIRPYPAPPPVPDSTRSTLIYRSPYPSYAHVKAILEPAGEPGILWIGTWGGGLNRLKDGRLTTYTTRDGLFHDDVLQILEDDQGYL